MHPTGLSGRPSIYGLGVHPTGLSRPDIYGLGVHLTDLSRPDIYGLSVHLSGLCIGSLVPNVTMLRSGRTCDRQSPEVGDHNSLGVALGRE